MKKKIYISLIASIFVVTVSFAATISEIYPAASVTSQSVNISLVCENTAFTIEDVIDVQLSNNISQLSAVSFDILSDTHIEAEFELTHQGIWDVVIETDIQTLSKQNSFTSYLFPDLNGDGIVDLADFALFAKHYLDIAPIDIESPDITWVDIDDPGFQGQMSKYPTTNSQFAHYLNDALYSDDIFVEDDYVKGQVGSFGERELYNLEGTGFTYYGAINGGKSRIIYTGEEFVVEQGFENHPVTYVSWYGATAFCGYYGWRLPTVSEWQSVANYDGSYTYATGNAIYNGENFFANYESNGWDQRSPSNLPYHTYYEHGTNPVGYFGSFGYGLSDMSGNVWEWTVNTHTIGVTLYRKNCGGGWDSSEDFLETSFSGISLPDQTGRSIGFRVCR